MSFSVIFNESELNEYLIVNDVRRGIGSSRVNKLVNISGANGSSFVNQAIDSKVIEIDFTLKSDLINKRERLADILSAKNPRRLILEDEPNIFYLAIVDGDVNVSENHYLGKGTITFLIPDGISHAIVPKYFNLETEGTSKLFKINNGGTYKSRPSFEFEILKDTDGFGIVSEEQVMQLGTIESSDIIKTEAKTLIWKDDLEPVSKTKWQPNIAKPNFSTSDDRLSKVMGSMSWINSGFVPTNFGTIDTSAPGYWHGPSESRYIGQQLDNWELYTRITFRPTPKGVTGTNRSKQQGLLEINMYDEDNQLICGFHFKDNTQTSDLIEYSVYLSGVQVYKNSMPRAYHTEDGGFYGFLWIRKIGNKFSLELVKTIGAKQTWKKNLNFANEDAARLKANRVDYWMAQWGTRPSMDMRISYSTLFKTNVEDEKDIPEIFYEGDIVFVDSETGKIFINGGGRAKHFIQGSKFIECEKGITDVYVLADDGAVTGRAILEEKYL